MPIRDPAGIAGRFLAARRAAVPLADYPGCAPGDLAEAYRIQDHAISGWGRDVIGWKVGRVMPPVSETLGTERLAGPIFAAAPADADRAVAMPVFDGGFAAGEAEFLLRIGAAPPAGKTRFTLDEAAELIDAVHVGIEIASSPLATINALGPLVVISDFGNNNGLLVGPAVPDWRTSGFEQWDVTTLIDGRAVGCGKAAAFPDGAIGSARFLFELMAARGIALRPGQWISSGAIGGVHDAHVGQRVEADFGGRFKIACTLIEAQPDRD
ncbi:2-keto-4-pentenoate hydratase [Sphingomonas changnyeongensis]|uniref:2-keto-4-pentenoate hydratase n=1 Tax=Sphingomonas changnyeongensis TaxID=2698679 RepID=A0A7Z2S9M8_9SPHN|nr:2-keto-4-pentenoate hydratase [Sphingomonas changnyeongensis]